MNVLTATAMTVSGESSLMVVMVLPSGVPAVVTMNKSGR